MKWFQHDEPGGVPSLRMPCNNNLIERSAEILVCWPAHPGWALSAEGAPLYQPGPQAQVMGPVRKEGLKARSKLMPQSLSLVIVHAIFSTKERMRLLDDESRAAMHSYLATVARNAGCECYRVGGVADHVHLAIRLSRTITIAELIEKLKTTSSKWAKTQSPRLARFAWQRGYGCFSVGPADLKALNKYIEDQETHHRKRTFQDEFRMFLKQYGVKYDEAYVWD
jgi:putative transposase